MHIKSTAYKANEPSCWPCLHWKGASPAPHASVTTSDELPSWFRHIKFDAQDSFTFFILCDIWHSVSFQGQAGSGTLLTTLERRILFWFSSSMQVCYITFFENASTQWKLPLQASTGTWRELVMLASHTFGFHEGIEDASMHPHTNLASMGQMEYPDAADLHSPIWMKRSALRPPQRFLQIFSRGPKSSNKIFPPSCQEYFKYILSARPASEIPKLLFCREGTYIESCCDLEEDYEILSLQHQVKRMRGANTMLRTTICQVEQQVGALKESHVI